MSKNENNQSNRVIILDTSAFLAGFDPFSSTDQQTTVPKVEDEIKKNSIVSVRFVMALENGKVRVKEPTGQFLSQASISASQVGDSVKLSETDIQLLALALELRAKGLVPKIISDDYSIQNVATRLGVEFQSLATFGIKRLLEWVRYCPACFKEYSADCKFKECQICGTQLKRKPRRTVKTLKEK